MLFHHKNVQQTRNRGNFLHLIKDIYEKLTSHLMVED